VLGEIPDKETALGELPRPAAGWRALGHRPLPDPHYQPLARLRALALRLGFRERSLGRGRLAFTASPGRPAAG
jgi:hypothetical protein